MTAGPTPGQQATVETLVEADDSSGLQGYCTPVTDFDSFAVSGRKSNSLLPSLLNHSLGSREGATKRPRTVLTQRRNDCVSEFVGQFSFYRRVRCKDEIPVVCFFPCL